MVVSIKTELNETCSLSVWRFINIFLLSSIVPESPRWLIQKGRFAEAKAVLQWMARVNKRPDPDFTLLTKLSAQYNREALLDSKQSFLDMFKTKRMVVNLCTTSFVS